VDGRRLSNRMKACVRRDEVWEGVHGLSVIPHLRSLLRCTRDMIAFNRTTKTVIE
jgi:hypothetical protein